MADVWDHSQQTGTHLLMLLALADHANDAGECWPVINRLAAKCRVNRRQARYLIKDLEEAGELRIERGQGRGHPSVYTVKGAPNDPFPIKEAEETPFQKEKGQPGAPIQKEKGQSGAPIQKRKGALQRQEKGHSSAPALQNARGVLREPSEEPSEEEVKTTPPPPSDEGDMAVVPDSTSRSSRQHETDETGFASWWALYPPSSRVDKKACARKWHLKHLEPRTEEIIAHTEAMKQTLQWQEGKIPHTTTYLNQERYDTPPPPVRASPAPIVLLEEELTSLPPSIQRNPKLVQTLVEVKAAGKRLQAQEAQRERARKDPHGQS